MHKLAIAATAAAPIPPPRRVAASVSSVARREPDVQRSPSLAAKMSTDIKLISLVKEFPDLYDTRRPNYKDTVLKETIWTEIANTINTPGIRTSTRH
jgi:Alcohol dehydrogenase transcription factor Myb/SANT-like